MQKYRDSVNKVEENFKRIARKKFLNLLHTQKEEDRLKGSSEIQEKVLETAEFQKAKTILFYASFDGEVETLHMMKQAKKLGKKVVLPKIIENDKCIVPVLVDDLENDLILGPYGIKQPKDENMQIVSAKDIDLAIVPGVAFDKNNCRLGRGGGYYDRFLGMLNSGTPTFGLAFYFQVTESLPSRQEHDICVSRVIVNEHRHNYSASQS